MANKNKKIPGATFLQNHPTYEQALGLADNFVIVNKKDWEETIEILKLLWGTKPNTNIETVNG